MDERLRFIARLLEGEKMSPLCREFGISRVTGYKIYDRYKTCGLEGLNDRSRRPYRHANKLPFQVERTILGIKKEYSSWGAPKIRDKLIREFPMIKPPAVSTVHAVLDRNGLVKRRKRRRYKAKKSSRAAVSIRLRTESGCADMSSAPAAPTEFYYQASAWYNSRTESWGGPSFEAFARASGLKPPRWMTGVNYSCRSPTTIPAAVVSSLFLLDEGTSSEGGSHFWLFVFSARRPRATGFFASFCAAAVR
jgi:transposase